MQRVSSASVEVLDAGAKTGGARLAGSIGRGLLVYIGVGREDTGEDAAWLADKAANLRIFHDQAGLMNRSLLDEGASALVVSQFTLFADARKGRRPSYSDAAPPDLARGLYDDFVLRLRALVGSVETGEFQAEMRVTSANEGPVTILLDSRKTF